MRHITQLLILGTTGSALVATKSAVLAQEPIARVAITIEDDASRGIFRSAFSTALRALGDVEVVTPSETPDYILSGVILCQPTCANAASYTLALRLAYPVPDAVVDYAVSLTRGAPFNRLPTTEDRDSTSRTLIKVFSPFDKTVNLWALVWGRDRYEQAVRELVNQLNATCFERMRIMRRVANQTDAAVRTKMINEAMALSC